MSLTPDLIDLRTYRHPEYRVDLPYSEVIVYHLSRCDEVYELLERHEPLLTPDSLSPRVLLVDVLQGPQVLLDHNVTALVVQLLLAELGEVKLFEEGDHVVLEAVSDRMLLGRVAVR